MAVIAGKTAPSPVAREAQAKPSAVPAVFAIVPDAAGQGHCAFRLGDVRFGMAKDALLDKKVIKP
jgi:hypothetical protein